MVHIVHLSIGAAHITYEPKVRNTTTGKLEEVDVADFNRICSCWSVDPTRMVATLAKVPGFKSLVIVDRVGHQLLKSP